MTSTDSADPTSVNDVLAMRARWEEIPVDMIEAATKLGPVTRPDLERYLREAGYVYEIRFDAFMPPQYMVSLPHAGRLGSLTFQATWHREHATALRAIGSLPTALFHERCAAELDSAANAITALSDAARALVVEREVIGAKAREWAAHYPEASDGRNTFVLFAEWVDSRQ